MRVLSQNEIQAVNGGFFWLALPIVIAAGYTLGKDRAVRDREVADASECSC